MNATAVHVAGSPRNPLADLASKATTASATAGRNDSLNVGKPLTGEYLFNEFLTPDRSEQTRMRLIEQWADTQKGVDTATLNKAIKDMVERASKINDATKKSAQTTASALRALYGALKFARDELLGEGFEPGKTGFNPGRVIATKVLKSKGIHWTGEYAKTAEDRERAREGKRHKEALEAAMTANPMKPGEDYAEYTQRLIAEAAQKKAEIDAEARMKQVQKLAERVKDMCGDMLHEVLQCIVDQSIEQEGEEQPQHPMQGE